jgi:hypothetical protein
VAFVDYRGEQILDAGFAEFLVDEGIMEQPEEEEDAEEPEEGDYIMSDCGPLGSRTQVTRYNDKWAGGMRLRTFEDEELAVEVIKEDMEAKKYWPNVWKRDDHGGITLYDMD